MQTNTRYALVTGVAGFIGSEVAHRLLNLGWTVIGIDNLNDYYDQQLKLHRLESLKKNTRFHFDKMDVCDEKNIEELFDSYYFELVVHLAGQAGVRYSIDNPKAYIQGNLVGFGNILECCRHHQIAHLVFASSSSVYGNNTSGDLSESIETDHPVSLYAATKKSNEVMAHSYSSLYGLPITALRFFTVYGPKGRPDMAYYKFTKAIMEGRSIDIYNRGNLERDFTYIDDIVDGIIAISSKPPSDNTPFSIFNIGNNQPVKLGYFVEVLEKLLGVNAIKNLLPMQPGDVYRTCADINKLDDAIGFTPKTPIEMGLKRFVDWYLEYHQQTSSAEARAC